jgi:hypothetical protein
MKLVIKREHILPAAAACVAGLSGFSIAAVGIASPWMDPSTVVDTVVTLSSIAILSSLSGVACILYPAVCTKPPASTYEPDSPRTPRTRILGGNLGRSSTFSKIHVEPVPLAPVPTIQIIVTPPGSTANTPEFPSLSLHNYKNNKNPSSPSSNQSLPDLPLIQPCRATSAPLLKNN